MKALPQTEAQIQLAVLKALKDYPNLPLTGLRNLVNGRSSRVTLAIKNATTPLELKRRKAFFTETRMELHRKENLPKAIKKYIDCIETSAESVGKEFSLTPTTVTQGLKDFLGVDGYLKVSGLKRSYQKSLINPKTRVVESRGPGEFMDKDGYIQAQTPQWMIRESQYSLKHQIVILEALGLDILPKGYIVHHINEDKTDNRIENLALMTNAAHMALHQGNSHPLLKLNMWEYEEFTIWKSKKTTVT